MSKEAEEVAEAYGEILGDIASRIAFVITQMKSSNTTFCTNILKEILNSIEALDEEDEEDEEEDDDDDEGKDGAIKDNQKRQIRVCLGPQEQDPEEVQQTDSPGGGCEEREASSSTGPEPELEGVAIVPQGAEGASHHPQLLGPAVGRGKRIVLPAGKYAMALKGGGKVVFDVPYIFGLERVLDSTGSWNANFYRGNHEKFLEINE